MEGDIGLTKEMRIHDLPYHTGANRSTKRRNSMDWINRIRKKGEPFLIISFIGDQYI